MKLTRIKRKDLKRGDTFCEITAMADRPVMIAFKDGDDPFFDQRVFEREVHRIDMPDYTHELTRFSWKLKDLDDKVEAIITRNKRNGALVETMSKQDAHIEGLKTKIDAHDEEPTIRLNECRHAKQTLQGIIDTLESEVEKLRMKIFDIEGREDLVTAELEKENRDLKEDVAGKSEIIRQWKNNWCPAKCAEKQKTIDMLTSQIEELTEENDYLRDAVNKEGVLADNVVHDNKELKSKIEKKSSYIKGLISDKTILQDTIQKMIVDEQTKRECMRRHIAELEEMHDIDIQAWSKRESELLQMVEDRDTVIGRQRTSIQGLILSRGEKDELIGEMQFDLDRSIKSNELLNVMLKIVNPIIKSGDYSNVESSRFLSIEMFKLCRDVIAFRRSHNIV